jgi:hypothetical protein
MNVRGVIAVFPFHGNDERLPDVCTFNVPDAQGIRTFHPIIGGFAGCFKVYLLRKVPATFPG